jgi:hypothetical protein
LPGVPPAGSRRERENVLDALRARPQVTITKIAPLEKPTMGKPELAEQRELQTALYLVAAQAGYLRALVRADVVDEQQLTHEIEQLAGDVARVARIFEDLRRALHLRPA